MGGCRGAMGARAVLRDGGIRRTSPESAAAGGATRSCIHREMACERDGLVGDEADPVASVAALCEEKRLGPAARWEERE